VFVLDFHGRGALRSFLPPADVTVTEEQVTGVADPLAPPAITAR
jgi:hypothetical protein